MTAAQLAWLEQELPRWQGQGQLDPAAAASIRAQYAVSRRFSLARLMLGLGGSFLGVGVLWLVAAHLDALPPLARFAGVVLLWLGAVAGAELLAVRRDSERDAVVGAVRLVAALTFGAVVFQAAQSLQVPAHEPGLVGAWGAGALLHAYATRAVAPLVVGVVTGVGWYVWVVAEGTESVAGAAVALLLAAVLSTAVAVAHEARWQRTFGATWRSAAALLALVGLFVSALPGVDRWEVDSVPLLAGAVVVLLAAAAAGWLGDRTHRLEVAVVVSSAVFGVLVLRWQPATADSAAELSGAGLLRAVVALAGYLLLATWFAGLGVLREASGLTTLATAALVVFTVVQSFAVFEPLLSGAALFLVLGAVLGGTGYVVDRGRRRLVADVREVRA